MPPGRDGVLIIGISEMTMLRSLLSFPALFDALTVKLNVPVVVGIPVIAPFASYRLRPVGNSPLIIDHVIGVVPVAASFWL